MVPRRRIPLLHIPLLRMRPAALALAVSSVALAGCDSFTGTDDDLRPPAPAIVELPRALSSAETEVIRASSAFGLDLLRHVVADDPSATHVVSPLSASVALGMALNGAAGTTFSEMRETLGFAGTTGDALDLETINRSYRDIVSLLVDLDSEVSFRIANSVWHDMPWTLTSAFRDGVRTDFDAHIAPLDFSDPAAPDQIDSWVSEATNGRIPSIAPRPIPPDAVAYLINALHFAGDWRLAFDEAETVDHVFDDAAGAQTPIRLMQRDDTVHLGSWNGHDVLDLPYGGAAWSMTLMLPEPGTTVPELLAELDAETWNEALATLQSTRARIGVPRFTLKWQGELSSALKSMGMPSAFLAGVADFSRLFEQADNLFLTEVKQKTWLRVDEQGTEAAAATSVGVGVTSMPPSFVADRPFVLAIRERLTGTILFLGAIQEAPLDAAS